MKTEQLTAGNIIEERRIKVREALDTCKTAKEMLCDPTLSQNAPGDIANQVGAALCTLVYMERRPVEGSIHAKAEISDVTFAAHLKVIKAVEDGLLEYGAHLGKLFKAL